MEKLTTLALYQSIEDMIKLNKPAIVHDLFENTDPSMTSEQIYGIMISNCLALSVKMSIQSAITLLEDAGLLNLDDRRVAKLYLQHLSSQLTE